MKQTKKWLLVALALLALISLPLVGCKNDSVSEPVTSIERPVPYIVTDSNVISVIQELTAGGSYILEAEDGSYNLPEIAEALISNPHAKVNLDLSNVESLKNIEESAFSVCKNLTSISIPSSVTVIGANAFEGCRSLDKVTFAEGSKLETIEDYAFYECSSLTSINIPSGVKTIGNFAFQNCSVLTEITFAGIHTLTTIGMYTFAGCNSLIGISLPSTVTAIGKGTFYGCSSLESMSIPSTVTTIGELAFQNCSGLKSITIPDSVTEIGEGAFYNCSGLTTVTFEDESKEGSTLTIGDGAFYGCSNLESIFNKNVISLPSRVTKIGNKAFYECSKFEGVTIKAIEPPELGKLAFPDSIRDIWVPEESLWNYSSDVWVEKGWSDYEGKIRGI